MFIIFKSCSINLKVRWGSDPDQYRVAAGCVLEVMFLACLKIERFSCTDSLRFATGREEKFELSAYKKYCLVNALDDIDYLLEHKDRIEAYEKASSRY